MGHDTLSNDGAARIIEIADDRRWVTMSDNMLSVAGEAGDVERIPVDEIAGLVAYRPGPAWTAAALSALTERGAGIVLCGPNHDSQVMSWPIPKRRWNARIRAQLSLYPPLARCLVAQLESAARAQRAFTLETMGRKGSLMALISAPPPIGARGAAKRRAEELRKTELKRRYWPWLVGPGFRRCAGAPGRNAVISYGHTQLRIAATRAVHAARLHPGAGLRGRAGEGGLADDLAIPFQPVVDLASAIFIATGSDKVDARVECAFAGLLDAPLRGDGGPAQIRHGLMELAESFARCLETGEAKLDLRLPALQDPDAIFALMAGPGGSAVGHRGEFNG